MNAINRHNHLQGHSQYAWLTLLGLLSFLLASCSTAPEIAITEDTIYDLPASVTETEYLLGPGDVIEIVYHYQPKPDETEYLLAVGDELRIEFAYHPEIDRNLTVRPDGSITLPRKGSFPVIDKTPSQLRKEIAVLYSDEFIEPIVTVTMVQYNRAIDHLKKAITTSARGQSKLTTIRPGGYVSFPVIDDIKAAGMTLPTLKKVVTTEYTKLIDNLTVTIILKVMNANLAYVAGEVSTPNVYLMPGPTTITQLIAMAGGLKETAERSTVVVISRTKDGKPWGRLVDLDKIFSTGNIGEDIFARQYDVIYVPKSRIARANLFVEQYLSRMMPDWIDMGYNLGGTMIDHDPLIE